MKIRTIGIIANSTKLNAVEYTSRLRSWLLKRGIAVALEKEIAEKIRAAHGLSRIELATKSDLIVVFGGDGTLLMAARSIKEFDVPILGINLGSFGFMTVVNLNEMFPVMDLILRGEFHTSRRMMLEASVPEGKEHEVDLTALNDIVINRGSLSRMVTLETFVNDRYLASFRADGLIISTPTGSTAYSLSAGGPIVFPELNSIIISPICPHTLTNRPIVLPSDAVLKVVLGPMEDRVPVTLDGQVSFVLKSKDTILIRKSDHYIYLVDSYHRDYLEILRTKLGWGGQP